MKQNKRTLEEKNQDSKRIKKSATISYLMKKYSISSQKTASRWNQEYDEERLGVEKREKRKSHQKIWDIDIKKSYAFLIEICSQQHK